MNLSRDVISKLNDIAKNDFEKAKAMLEGINLVLGTKYGWLGKRVVFFEDPDADVAEKYAHCHDALSWAV